MTDQWLDTVVESRRMATDRIEVLDLVRTDGAELPEFEAGAHVDVLVDAELNLVRQYSLCGPTHDRSRYRLGILLEPASRGGSVRMHALTKGDLVRISSPRNRFGIAGDARRHVLVAGGVGITPLLAMSYALRSVDADWELHYCARSRDDAAFADELDGDPRVTFHFDDGPPDRRLAVTTDVGLPRSDTALYVCGPGGFMDFVITSAADIGWDPSSIHMERFAPSEAAAAAGDAFVVRLARSGGEFVVPATESVLDVLTDNGIDAPYSCQQGICGECIVTVLAGEPDHRDDVLTDRERALGQFATCTSRSHSTILELDL
ncbi:oxidoreductase [Rhodococcus sp. BP-241]|uniref:PDR/VanB family oxidoreductase n=1 Tax=Rhodococcus sp. BP-241 TaxID=2739441 RepID=UPI001C9A7741|nr:PDR/VanB family oxidoreductase [Rhodococcus sp. BP-241]MBY6708648.1 oxidoreductase [Rhodococcus sp. BP-241]